jgi:HD-GYP domain-containing protein (c-di-GMP phosphodiesterase class II)
VEHKVSTLYLKTGMYVSDLDRPWIDTPFLIQGFLVTDEEDIKTLQQYCEYVVIDTSRGAEASFYITEDQKLPTNNRLEQYLSGGSPEVEYADAHSTEDEMPLARQSFDEASIHIADMLEALKQGKKLEIETVKAAVEPILDSVIRNPEALMWLTQLQDKNKYTYTRSLDNCALAIAFGRHMGLPKDDLRTLAIGHLLMDTGMVKVPNDILEKDTPLTDTEFEQIKKHVEYSVDILRHSSGIDIDVINIALTHHERFDGSGYPEGLVGNQVPVYGRMAAIVDCYDAMTSKRAYGKAVSPHRVLQQIYNWRNKYFQDELVEQFLQCLGVYPTGSLVEMTSGEVGIVLAQNRNRRLRPKVMLLLDSSKQAYPEYRTIDLLEHVSDNTGHELSILHGLDPGAFGIDPTEFYL